ncbi:MAG: hypothetical protein IPJ19_11865 [Planctomycetes bacterium]|nr:hypothetical protein [Planctomycetota bacterium]
MKFSIPAALVLAASLFVASSNSAATLPATAHAQSSTVRDDPPPEPLDCPFCAGNGLAHVRRMFILQKHIDVLAGLLTRW